MYPNYETDQVPSKSTRLDSENEPFMTLKQWSERFCWPTRNQWKSWAYTGEEIAKRCLKKVGRCYVVDVRAFETYMDKK